jgi:signal transduction histidine kinase
VLTCLQAITCEMAGECMQGVRGILPAGTEISQLLIPLAVAVILAMVLVVRLRRGMRRDRAARVVAERAASQADRIAQLTAALAQARTTAAAVDACVHEPVHVLRAEAGVLFLINSDGSRAEVARAVGYPPDSLENTLTLSGHSPLSDAIGRGAPLILDTTAIIPLLVGSRVVAVARYDFNEPRVFSDEDRVYFEALATRGAQALDRTWQYEFALRARAEAETQRTRADQEIGERQKIEVALRASEARGRALAARTSRLHALTAALSESVTLEDVARAVVHQGMTAAGAAAGEVALLADTGQALETVYAEGPGTGNTRLPLDEGVCAREAIEMKRPVFVTSFDEWQERFPKSASLAADGGYVSSATVPLLVKGTAMGMVAFYFTAPVNFDDEYRALLVSVAQDCAQALDRARLYEAAQKARGEAESANRLKDEFVSIVSHELRSPLNAILGWTAMLRRGDLEPTLVRRALQSVHDNATRQARLIEELLDFSRVSSGRLALVKEEIDLRDLLRGVVEAQIPEAAAKGVTMELGQAPPIRVSGDARRLEQVFFNLLGNALKFTPSGGQVLIGVEAVDGQVMVRVADTGIGIDPEFLPHVFERFRQGEQAARREYGGLGLGLSIARQLVELHHGTIDVESAGTGRGSTFSVTLPIHSTRRKEDAVALPQ